jgi:hypothetical protein
MAPDTNRANNDTVTARIAHSGEYALTAVPSERGGPTEWELWLDGGLVDWGEATYLDAGKKVARDVPAADSNTSNPKGGPTCMSMTS